MKLILFSHFKPFPPNHGAAHRIWHIAKGLKENNVEVLILSNKLSRKNKKETIIKEGIKIISLPFLLKIFRKKHFIFQLNPLMLIEFLKNRNCDAVQIEFPYLIPLGIIAKLFKKKLFYSSHGVEYYWQKQVYNSSRLIQAVAYILEWLSLKISDKIIVCSKKDLQILKKLYKIDYKKFIILPSSVEPQNYKKFKRYPYPKKSILFVGSYLHPANDEALDIIINKIAPEFKSKKAEFYIVGKNKKWAAKNKNENVKFLGEVRNIEPYIKGADLCIAPILKGTGTRIKLLEYASAAKCILTTTKCMEGLNFSKNKDIIIENNMKNFAKKINSLLRNKKLVEKIGKNAYKTIQEGYTTKKVVSKHPMIKE